MDTFILAGCVSPSTAKRFYIFPELKWEGKLIKKEGSHKGTNKTKQILVFWNSALITRKQLFDNCSIPLLCT